MSEKKLREFVQHIGPCAYIMDFGHRPDIPRRSCDCGLTEVLSAEPDVVQFCRALLEEAETERCDKPFNWPIVMATLENQVLKLQAQFHFRLTETGWEWTEEE